MAAMSSNTPDIGAAARHVDEHGYCVIPNVLSADQVSRLRATLDRLVAEDIEAGVELGYGPNESNRRVSRLLQRSEEFVELALNPVILAVARQMLGYDDVILSIMSANITGPGGDRGIGVLHTDQGFLPGFFPRRLFVNSAFFLDDYTPENGATVFVPGSHKQESKPPSTMPPASELGYMTGPAGSLAVWDGFIHHATGLNRTTDKKRRGVIVSFVVPYLRGQENWTRSLSPQLIEKYPALGAITGFSEWRTLGGVHGSSAHVKSALAY
jgi:ectoine hydroxylase-related dioxygenase (phytanoyl-CoA dioxygenase family)